MISNNGSLRSIIIVNHADGWLAFSPFSKRVAYAKSKNVLASFVESENRKFAHEVVCSPIGSSKSIKRVSLILTKDCPMRCIYCYTHAGEVKTEMPRELALRSIREVAEEGIDTLHVTFFGGEPTLCMETVRACVNLARTLAPNCLFHISTGGVASEHVVDYIAEQGFTVNLSMDGPPDIQNLLRPLPDGKPSAEFAERTIKRLVASGASFKVRATVTELNVTRLSESVEYWGGLGVKFVHFEPINIIGRASRAEMALPDADVYIASFIAALDTAETLGIGLINSAYMNLLNPSPCYCTTVAGDKIIVAPDGAVTLCYEVQECGHQLSDFVIGKYDQETD
nr:radical SAM protein [bacterium]